MARFAFCLDSTEVLRMATDTSNPELSVSRINRLMRPLRNRCDALAALAESTRRPINCVTYSSRPNRSNSFEDIESPPLAVLQPPGSIHSRTHFSKNGTERLEMSRRVYAVRDSFRDIVVKIKPGQGQPMGAGNSVMLLSAMCSMVIGANLQYEVDEENDNDMEGTDFVNEIYEAVPLEYRRWMVLSRALNLVHGTNVRDATLFTILFDVTTSYGLLNESSAFLRSLLLVAFSPISTSSTFARLSHPAHTTFLLDLRTRWVSGGLPDPAFLSIITEALSSTQDVGLWTCKAVKKLAHSFCNTNLPLFMRFLGVCSSIATGTNALKPKSRHNMSSNVARLHNQLYKWVKLVVNQYPFAPDSVAVLYSTTEDSDAILGFLKMCLISSLAFKTTHRNDDDTSLSDLQGAIISLATHWLTGPFASTYPLDLALVVNRQRAVTPQTSTYDTLVQGLFSHLDFHNGLQALSEIAGALKSHKLLHLEASMWSCALRHIELPENERRFITMHGADSFNQYRHQLINTVEDAERRCFGQSVFSLALTPNNSRKRTGTVLSEATVNRGWKWEAMVDSWIHGSARQPSAKKRRFEENHWLRSTRLRHHSSRHSLDGGVKTTLKRAKLTIDKQKQTLNKTSSVGSADGGTQKYSGQPAPLFRSQTQRRLDSRRHSWVTPNSTECMKENDDLSLKEDSFSDDGWTVDNARTPLARRSSNFASLIADALTRRTELHASRGADVGRNLRCTTDLSEYLGSSPPKVAVGPSRAIFLPSDDSLDLFAHGQISPVVCR